MENSDSNESSIDSNDSNEDELEDPEWAGMGKFYKTQTPNRKEMVKMFKRFCDLTDRDASAIVVYFGVYSEAHLAEFLY
jgi:hypothetical protein